MTRCRATLAGVVLVLGLASAAIAFTLFHGYFDHGLFEVKQTALSSSGRVAIVAERSDHEAMSSDHYFVLVGSHQFSADQLRYAFHSDAVVFDAADSCVALHWEGPNKLVITCDGSSIGPEHINVQKRQSDGTTILYANIPTM